MHIHQTYQRCSSCSPEDVLYLFEVIHNQKWPPWPLIGRDIFSFFFHITVCEITRFARNIPLGKFCYFWELFEIQDGCTDLWLTWCILYFFSNTTACQVTRLARNIPLGSVGSFWNNSRFKTTALVHDLLRHYSLQTSAFQVIWGGVLSEVLLLFSAILNPSWMIWYI